MDINEYTRASMKLSALNLVPCGVGAPGIGKTKGLQAEYEAQDVRWISQSVPLLGPQYVTGYPFRHDGKADHAPFGLLAEAFAATSRTHLHWSDLGAGSESTIKELLQLFQFRQVHGRQLPDCVTMSADSNDVSQGAGVFGLIEPMKDRVVLLPVNTSVESVIVHGLANGWPGWYLGWLRNSEVTAEAPLGAVHDWKPSKSLKCSGATPRGHEDVCRMINAGILDKDVWAGRIGDGRAMQAYAFMQLQAELPDVDALLMDPDNAPVPENPSAQWLVAGSLAGRMNGSNFGQCVKYLRRLPAMFRVFSIRNAFLAQGEMVRKKKTKPDFKPIAASLDYTAWSCSDEGKTIAGMMD